MQCDWWSVPSGHYRSNQCKRNQQGFGGLVSGSLLPCVLVTSPSHHHSNLPLPCSPYVWASKSILALNPCMCWSGQNLWCFLKQCEAVHSKWCLWLTSWWAFPRRDNFVICPQRQIFCLCLAWHSSVLWLRHSSKSWWWPFWDTVWLIFTSVALTDQGSEKLKVF
jgi:hypothetical protein